MLLLMNTCIPQHKFHSIPSDFTTKKERERKRIDEGNTYRFNYKNVSN
jgi:hypothetical protein